MRKDIYAYAIGLLLGLGTLLAESAAYADACCSTSPSYCIPQYEQNECSYPVAYVDSSTSADDHYFEGYIQGVVDSLYSEYQILISVHCGVVYIANMPCDFVVRDRVLGMVCDIPGVKKIAVCNKAVPEYVGCKEKEILRGRAVYGGEWMPPYGSLFQPLIADPRQVSHSAALRMGDETFGPSLGAVSFGNEIPIYRWFDQWCPGGMLQVGIEAGVFAVFKLNVPSMDLQNADYYVGIPLTYVHNCWSYRLRLYHISSHLGDEFLLLETHPGLVRLNPSFEALDFFASYMITKNLRLYGGVGIYVDSDVSYPQKTWYIAYGFEIRIPGGRSACYKLYWEPVFGAYIANREFQDWKFDITCFAGFEVGRNEFIGNRARLGFEYHDGFSVDGQFQKFRTNYTSLKLSYYF